MTAARSAPGGALGAERAAVRELGEAFKRTLQTVRRMRGREARDGTGLSEAQFGLLFGLFDHAEPLPTREVAGLADVSPATATQMLESMEADGLVARRRSDADRRIVLTSLTERGHTLVAERRDRFAPRWIAATAPFSDAELRTAAAVLDALRGVFEADDAAAA